MKYLGVDFGLRRIGLATSEGMLASPLKTIKVKGFKDALKQVIELVGSEDFDKIVVGLPEGKIGQNVLGFVKALKKANLAVETFDETLSSQKALSQLIEQNVPKSKRQINDATAAAIILQDYLDSR